MNAKRGVSIVLVLMMVLSMVFTNVVFAEDTAADDEQLSVGQSASEAGVQKSGGFEAATVAETGRTITVDPTKGETITAALDTAVDGDTILVKNGTVPEKTKVTVMKSVKIVAENPGQATVKVGFVISRSNVTIQGLVINNYDKPEFDEVISIVDDTANCKIIGNTITVSNGCYGVITAGKQDGHIISGNTFNTAANATAKALVFIGIHSDGEEPKVPTSEVQDTLNVAKNITINGTNVFDGKAEYGVVIEGLDCTVAGNTFKLNAIEARLCNTVSRVTIEGNTFAEITGFTHFAAQFSDVSKKLDLEVVRKANTFQQAAYYIKGHKIYYYIQDAIDMATSNVDPDLAGAEVVVGAGFYRENVEITGFYGNLKVTSIDGNPIENSTFATICPATGYALDIDGDDGDGHVLTTLQISNFEIQRMRVTDLTGGSFIKNKFNGMKVDEVVGGEGYAFAAEVYNANGKSTGLTSFISNLFTRANDAGLYVEDSNHIKLMKNEFSNNGYICHKCGVVSKLLEGDGARIENTNDLFVEDSNKFIKNYGDGLELNNITKQDPDHTIIRYNTFDENWRNGLYVRNSNFVDVITNKSIKANLMNGISFDNCFNVLVSKHSPKVSSDYQGILNNGLAGIQFNEIVVTTPTAIQIPNIDSTYITIEQNLIKNNGSIVNSLPVGGGALGISANIIKVTDNEILSNKGDGVEIVKATNNTITGNTITGNSKDGVDIQDGLVDLVSNNTIEDNGGIGVITLDPEGKADINHNEINRNAGGGISLVDGFRGDLIQYNNIRANGAASVLTTGGILIKDSSPYINDVTVRVRDDFRHDHHDDDFTYNHAKVHFNNIVGNINYGLKRDTEGRQALDPWREVKHVNPDISFYTWNFWGDVSGPEDVLQRAFADYNADVRNTGDKNLLGIGNKVIFDASERSNYRKCSVKLYTPWVSEEYTRKKDANGNIIPGRGIEIPGAGSCPVIPYALGIDGTKWNLTSIPMQLNPEYDSWNEIIDVGNKLEDDMILTYDTVNKSWKQPDDGITFDPLYGYYVKMKEVDFVPLVINATSPEETVLSERDLKAGWNLMGPAIVNWDEWTVKDVLAGVATTQFNPGWSQVFRPNYQYKYGSDKPSFTYTWLSETRDPGMKNFAGYWVDMQANRTLRSAVMGYFWDGEDSMEIRSLADRILNYYDVNDALEN